jgi:hypothetical protein
MMPLSTGQPTPFSRTARDQNGLPWLLSDRTAGRPLHSPQRATWNRHALGGREGWRLLPVLFPRESKQGLP